ncbi:MAG: DUF6178 family protein [Desulfomonilaceae bacterium]|nr:DUF6178 family protein [Desulfomonilaceae bacterium]
MEKRDSVEEAIRIVEVFNTLPIEKRVSIFRDLSAKAREELISSIARPGEIMRALSPEEVFYTVKELGEENALNLIAASTGNQLLYFLDIDLWKNDMFDTPSAARWLHIISSIGEDKMLHLLQTSDPELIVTAMSRFVKVQIRNPEVDLVEQRDTLPAFTLDDVFYLDFLVHESEDAIKSFLAVVFEWNTHYYFGLMEELARGVNLETEEMAGKWRRSRLADKGFPEFDEALEIYQYVLRRQIVESVPLPEEEARGQADGYHPHVWYPLTTVAEDSLFKRSLKEISDSQENDRLSMELAHLANKVMVADGRDPGSLEELQGSLSKVGGYINIALEEFCEDDVLRAAELLRANHVEILFRRGFSLILDLRKEAQKLLRDYDGGIENVGHPLAGLLTGLLQKRPYYAGNVVGESRTRNFESLRDVEHIRNLLDKQTLEEGWEPI